MLLLQVAQSQTLVTEWKYFCNNKPVQQLTEITCPRLAGFELYDCKLLTGCFYDDDCVQHVVSVKVVDADNDAHMREIAVLNMLRGELTDSAKRALNINLGNTTGTVEYLVFSYVALDLNSFLHAKSDIVVGLVHQAVCALAAVHSAHVMHGDIKPHNFSVRVHQHSHFRVVLGNFDHAVLLGEKPHGRSVPAYYPPETEYLKYEHPWVSPEVYHSLQQRQQQQQERHEAEASASLAGDEAGAQQQQQRMHWKDQNKKTRIAVEASLAIDVFSLGLIVGVAVDNECCRDRGKRMYERRDLPRVMASQMDLTMQFRAARCRSDPLAKKLLVCATNMMCLLDPLQRCKIDDILREIEL